MPIQSPVYLFIWRDAFTSCLYPGIVFAIASSEHEAREAVAAECRERGLDVRDLGAGFVLAPEIQPSPAAGWLEGSD